MSETCPTRLLKLLDLFSMQSLVVVIANLIHDMPTTGVHCLSGCILAHYSKWSTSPGPWGPSEWIFLAIFFRIFRTAAILRDT